MALLANGLETLEIGATAWRLIVNANIEKLYSKTECDTKYVAKAGSTMTGLLVLSANPSAPLGAATKQYVDDKVTLENIQDLLGSSFVNSTSIDCSYNDISNNWVFSVIFGTTSTTVATGNHKHNNMYSVTMSSDLSPSNMDIYDNFYITLGASIAVNNPTNHSVGQTGKVVFKQDVTGARVVTWGSYYLFPGGTEPTLSTVANAVDTFSYFVLSSTEILITNINLAMS
jgi:hypothetical protein